MTEVASSTESVSVGRPSYHLTAPRGWINDPCAPGYDPRTKLYHLFYQWNPKSHAWGDISWGHAVSSDLVYWEHTSDSKPVLVPDEWYDDHGIFTGCFFPTGIRGEKDQLSIIYSSVNHLPIAWNQPYKRGCEGLSIATSADGGYTWSKHRDNPILPEEPPDIHVTGFRDPFLSPWPALDALRFSDPNKGTLYGLVSGGIHDLGPRTFLYSIDPVDLNSWTYLHPLCVDVPVNYTLSDKWCGDLGANWECTNFVTLNAGEHSRHLVISGAEGGKERPIVSAYHEQHPVAARRVPRYANWWFGELLKTVDGVRMTVDTMGLLDWGIWYAASTFTAVDGTQVVWGWMIEEDLPDEDLAKKGWTGCLGIPRELFLEVKAGVLSAHPPHTDLSMVRSLQSSPDSQTITTLGVRPLSALAALRHELLVDLSPSALKSNREVLRSAPLSCEVQATIHVFDSTESVSLVVRRASGSSIHTAIVFCPQEQTITVDRLNSTERIDVNTSPDVGAFTLFRLKDEYTPGGVIEPLRLNVFLDADIIEVFANDRFALSTRVYSSPAATGISLTSEGGAWLEDLKVWGLGSLRRL